MRIEVHHFHHNGSDSPEIKQLLEQLLSTVQDNQRILKEIKMTDEQASALLDQVNTTTNAIAKNVDTDKTTLATVKTELETLLNQPAAQSGLSDATAAKLTAIAGTLGTLQTNAQANSDILTAIAAEGKPVIPPAPPANPPAA